MLKKNTEISKLKGEFVNIFNKHPFLIAEISFNYYDLAEKEEMPYFDVAMLLVEKAKECGVDGINFHVGDSEFLHCNFEEEDINPDDKLTFEDYRKLSQCCRELGLVFIVTPADTDVIDNLDDVVDVYKIPSSDLTNIPFIDYISNKAKPIILSTAASTLNEIKEAVNCIENNSNFKIALMHSVLSYPTKIEDANLLMIKDLTQYFEDYNIGYSDYTISDNSMFILTTAYNYGAVILEKYFTLDKSLKDHEFAMDEDDVRIFKYNVRNISQMNGFKNKQPLICESFSRKNVRKSIIAKDDINSGQKIEESDIEFKRPGIGIPPSQKENVVGKIAKKNIKKGSLIEYDMLS